MQNSQLSKQQILEKLFNQTKPNSRYISQSHIEDQINSITKQIINGDIQVNKNKGNIDQKDHKDSFQQILRKKYLSQIQRQKESLKQKLGFIQNTLASVDKEDFLRKRKSSLNQNLSMSRQNSFQWKKSHAQEMKKIQQKKKQILQKQRQKELQTQKLREKIKQQQKMKKKQQLQQKIKKIKQHSVERQSFVKQSKQKIKQLLNKKQLFQKMEDLYISKQENVLQQRKKKLAQIRQLKQPINLQQILQHEQKVMQKIKQKQILRQKQYRMMSSRARQYKAPYQSVFYKQIASPSQQQPQQNNAKQKLQKMRQFSQQVKSKYVPQIDQKKKKQLQQRCQKQKKHAQQLQERQKVLLTQPKLKGMQYLQLVKQLPKKKINSAQSPQNTIKTDRTQYKNYLGSMSMNLDKQKPWKTILKKNKQVTQAALFLQLQSQKVEQKLKRKQVYSRVMKIKDDGSIDQDYYEMLNNDIYNNRMNLLKSAFNLTKNNQHKFNINQIFDQLKKWDQERAKSMENHLKIIELVMEKLDGKLYQVNRYIEGLQKMMNARIQQIINYCKGGVNDSEFVLVPNHLSSLKPCHQLLKHLMMQQSQRQQQLSKKALVLQGIHDKLKAIKQEQIIDDNRESSSVRQLKSKIRFLIDCQLSDLIRQVLQSCQNVNKSVHEDKDFYWATQKFVRMANKQLDMHQQIGKQLISLVQSFKNRQKQLRSDLRDILFLWIKEDIQNQVFSQQLKKQRNQQLINQYYDIEQILPEQQRIWKGSIITYLTLIAIQPFKQHYKCIAYSQQVLYNNKKQTRIVITNQKYVYLFRLQTQCPDFEFLITKNIKIKQLSNLSLKVTDIKRSLLMKQEIQFQFTLEFNLQKNMKQFKQKINKFGAQILS